MEKVNMTVLSEKNTSTTIKSTSHSPVGISPMNLVIAIFMLVCFLVGILFNGLFLWVLGMKMKKTVNTLWFLHLILTYVISSSLLPFFAIEILLGFHWVFDLAMCKVLNSLVSLGMFATVFLLTVISLDRYVLVHHPVWSQHNRTISQAQRLITGVWLTSLILSAPYLAFRETQELEDGRIECVNNYALSSDWDAPEGQTLRSHIHLALFLTRFLLAFVIPFCIIMCCYCGMGWKMKKKRLARDGKLFKVLVVAVTSFFIGWAPYHLYHALLLFKEVPDEVRLYLRATVIITMCLNFCVTPILYLFVGEKFQQVCKMSIRALLKKAFVEISILPEDDATANGVANPNSIQSNL